MPQYYDNLSIERLSKLHPKVSDEAIVLIKKLWEDGVRVRVTHTYRSWKEQQELYKRGRTTPGQIVTNAIPGRSFHNYGLALDFVIMDVNNKPSYRVNDDWRKVVSSFKSAGWGNGEATSNHSKITRTCRKVLGIQHPNSSRSGRRTL